ncbi:D-alanyl-D-alanine carboxypeptidase family protein [Altericroceibacterium xinjiangense]|uniref:D-alanyl-D-alanine carboxypeptidase family protein n=1 Tax=Altericroceibacterium xinjiangense TaxID=762261 RepID=UPI001F493F80|nr:D-alanyl-D-alanine carboxypeptidase family protein [Altericroceibacterium xinjiangense]
MALLRDLSSGQTLFSKEPDRRFIPASVTKVMSVYTAFRLMDEGKIDPARQVVITKELADAWSGKGSSMFLKAGDKVSMGQLLLGVTTVSANDGAVALAVNSVGSMDRWLDLMNAYAADLGMRDSHFGRPNGYPDGGETYTSANDLARLARALTQDYPGLYHRYFGNHGMTYNNITQANHDPVTGVVEGADGMKTGWTREAGYTFLGSAERGGRRLVVVVAGADNHYIRDQTSRDLLRWGFDAFGTRVLLPKNQNVGQAVVQEGASERVGLLVKEEVRASVPTGASLGNVTLTMRYRGPVEAPITKGQEIGTLRVAVAGAQPYDVPLLAAESVTEAGFWQRLQRGITGLFS